MTNGDQIRNMTDKELVLLIKEAGAISICRRCVYDKLGCNYCYKVGKENCYEGMELWMNSEAISNGAL